MKPEYVLFVGPYPPPVHGQSFAFKMAYDHYEGSKILISQNLDSKNKFYRTYLALLCIFKYLKVFLKYKISVVYVAGSRSALGSFKDIILFRLAKLSGAKVIDHIHAAYFNKFIEFLPTFIQNYYIDSYRKVDVFVCLLPEMIKEYENFNSTSKIEVVENFYDPLMDNVDEFKVSEDVELVISYFSNLVYSKGIFDLIVAFNIVSKKYEHVRLKIAGHFRNDTYMTSEKVQKILEDFLSLNPRIEYVGPQFNSEKINFLRRSQIFVLPSFYCSEAFPISIIEAMRASNAIILTDHHYLPSLINVENGFIVKVGDVQAIAECIEKLILDKKLLSDMRFKNREYAKSKFALKNYTNSINSIIQKLNMK